MNNFPYTYYYLQEFFWKWRNSVCPDGEQIEGTRWLELDYNSHGPSKLYDLRQATPDEIETYNAWMKVLEAYKTVKL